MFILCTRNPVCNWWFSLLFPQKKKVRSACSEPSLSHLDSCTLTNSNLYFADSLIILLCDPDLYFCSYPKFIISYQFSVASVIPEDLCKSEALLNISQHGTFYGELFLRLSSIHKLEDLPSSADRGFLFRIFAAALHIWRPFPQSATWGRAVLWWQGVS